MLKHVNISVLGAVQGVFFRRTVKHEAGRRGISGFVRNESDGTVRIEAEGDEAALAAFVAWLKSGAGDGPHSVGQVDIEEGKFQGLTGFEIRD